MENEWHLNIQLGDFKVKENLPKEGYFYEQGFSGGTQAFPQRSRLLQIFKKPHYKELTWHWQSEILGPSEFTNS